MSQESRGDQGKPEQALLGLAHLPFHSPLMMIVSEKPNSFYIADQSSRVWEEREIKPGLAGA
jgi:hypothetical protein